MKFAYMLRLLSPQQLEQSAPADESTEQQVAVNPFAKLNVAELVKVDITTIDSDEQLAMFAEAAQAKLSNGIETILCDKSRGQVYINGGVHSIFQVAKLGKFVPNVWKKAARGSKTEDASILLEQADLDDGIADIVEQTRAIVRLVTAANPKAGHNLLGQKGKDLSSFAHAAAIIGTNVG